MRPKDAVGMANNVDPGLIRVYTVCSNPSVLVLRIFMVYGDDDQKIIMETKSKTHWISGMFQI